MTFNELIDIEPDINLATLIQLFLLGGDDKIYLDIWDGKKPVFNSIRIIDSNLQPFYERKIAYIEDSSYESHAIEVTLKKEQTVDIGECN